MKDLMLITRSWGRPVTETKRYFGQKLKCTDEDNTLMCVKPFILLLTIIFIFEVEQLVSLTGKQTWSVLVEYFIIFTVDHCEKKCSSVFCDMMKLKSCVWTSSTTTILTLSLCVNIKDVIGYFITSKVNRYF